MLIGVIKKDSVLVTDALFSYKALSSYSKSKYILEIVIQRRSSSLLPL
jgi:hypothetical protein